ncbi:MAG: Ig-like domain-containing protein [Candidatus Magasanikbacteria bacterium]|nr:Ig-like domain-containing protein [Candidatus Magasanikbacteria bacterium]
MASNVLNGAGELKRDAQRKLILDPGIKTRAQWVADHDLNDFYWKFPTSNALHTTAPVLTNITPTSLQASVATSTPLVMSFDEAMTIGTFRNVVLRSNKEFNVGYTYAGINYDSSGAIVTTPSQEIARTSAEILHTDFWQKPPNSTEAEAIYYPFVPSALNDNFQNCFYPAVMQGSTECVKIGTSMDVSNPDRLTNTNPSCFDLQASTYKGMCTSTAGCPFSPPPYNGQ